MITPAELSIIDFRKKYLGYMPHRLAKLRGQDRLMEFISWPWEAADGTARIKARSIDDPTSLSEYECRREISPVRWSGIRQRAYREGWNHGVRWATEEINRLTRPRSI